MTNYGAMKLGRRAIKKDSRTLRLASYMTPQLPSAPPNVDWTRGVTHFGQMLNDSLGDCTIAGIGHALQIWSSNIGSELTVPDATILKYYELWDGYNPSDPSTDHGGIELDVLNQWKRNTFDGHKLDAFGYVNPANLDHVRLSIWLFGGVYIGVSLPVSAQSQEIWDVVEGQQGVPGSWGGHCVFVPKYQSGKSLTCITWGQPKEMTEAFWLAYCDECYGLVSDDWLTESHAPSGFSLDQLRADLNAIS